MTVHWKVQHIKIIWFSIFTILIIFFSEVSDGSDSSGLFTNDCYQITTYPSGTQFGDLSIDEVSHIQKTVDLLGINLLVVGSAAASSRRNLNTSLPYGYGPDSKSDIDYLIPTVEREDTNLAWDFIRWSNDMNQLPGLGLHSVLAFPPEEQTWRVWFRPKLLPVTLAPNQPNLEYAPFEWPTIDLTF